MDTFFTFEHPSIEDDNINTTSTQHYTSTTSLGTSDLHLPQHPLTLSYSVLGPFGKICLANSSSQSYRYYTRTVTLWWDWAIIAQGVKMRLWSLIGTLITSWDSCHAIATRSQISNCRHTFTSRVAHLQLSHISATTLITTLVHTPIALWCIYRVPRRKKSISFSSLMGTQTSWYQVSYFYLHHLLHLSPSTFRNKV